MKLRFDIINHGDEEAGIPFYTEEVLIEVLNDPGGDPGEFAQECESFLSEWFDGADVFLKAD